MAPRLPQDVRDLIDLTRRGIAAVDGVLGRFWRDVERVFLPFASRALTREDRRGIMAAIDRIIGRVYGATQKAALVSELFVTMLRVTDAASDLPFRRAVERVRGLVERRDVTWWQRIRGQAPQRPNDPFLRVVTALDGPVVQQGRLVRSRLLDPQRRWVDPKGYRLSDRVWKQGRDARRAIDARLVEGIRNGEDAVSIARDLEKYLNPSQQPTTILRNGKVVRRNQTRYPGRGGWGSSRARALARTEISRVYNAAVHEAGKVTPGATGAKWNLSAAHPLTDRCDDHASNHSPGMGKGEYTFDAFPTMPDHSNCLCFETIVTVSREDMLDLLVNRYGD